MAGSFGSAVQDELLRRVAHARRPWIHADAARADCVVFCDEAELAACLICDWLRGSIAGHWWWRCVLGRLTAGQWLDRNVLARGDLLPAVVERLVDRRQAIHWIARLSESAARRAASAVAQAHGVEIPRDTAAQLRPESSLALGACGNGPGRAFLPTLLEHIPELRVGSPGAAQSVLLAIALAVRRMSGWARTTGFSAALAELHAAAQRGSLETGDAVHVIRATPGFIVARAPAISEEMNVHDHSSLPASVALHRRSKRRARALRDGAIVDPSKYQPHAGARPRVSRADAPGSVVAKHGPGPQIDPRQSRAPPRETESPRAPAVDLASARAIETRFGGLFYLLNLALALRLYGDFTSPRAACLTISPWDWLAFVGRAWFAREFQRDALGSVLADLAGGGRRRRRGPPRAFAAPDDWRPPQDWQTLLANASRGRIARGLIAGRWSTALLSYMQSRVALAVGIEEPEAALSLVCGSAARVRVSSTAVDVHFALADLPLEIRRAGLDRDPGWIPAAGRSVRFHFE